MLTYVGVLAVPERCISSSAAAAANSWHVPRGRLSPLQDKTSIGKVRCLCVFVVVIVCLLVQHGLGRVRWLTFGPQQIAHLEFC
jgi:hypothetical protein